MLTRKGSTLTLYRNGVQIGQRTDLPATAAATSHNSDEHLDVEDDGQLEGDLCQT